MKHSCSLIRSEFCIKGSNDWMIHLSINFAASIGISNGLSSYLLHFYRLINCWNLSMQTYWLQLLVRADQRLEIVDDHIPWDVFEAAVLQKPFASSFPVQFSLLILHSNGASVFRVSVRYWNSSSARERLITTQNTNHKYTVWSGLLMKLVWSRWQDVGQVLLFACLWRDRVKVHKQKRMRPISSHLGQTSFGFILCGDNVFLLDTSCNPEPEAPFCPLG